MTKVKVENTEAEEVKAENTEEVKEDKKEKAKPKTKKGKAEKKKEERAKTPAELLKEKEQEIQTLNDKLLRNHAEFENYRKRAFKDLTLARQATKIDTVTPVLNVFDIFGMAVQAANTSDNMEQLKVGLDMIQTEFVKALDDLGIKTIDATGKKFDHNLHEAVSYEASEDIEEGMVLKQWKNGYQLGDYVIRPASVVVSSGAANEAEEDKSLKEKAE